MQESPIFTRTYDFLRWLVPVTLKFPRQHRFVLAQVLQGKAFEFQEAILSAGQGNDTHAALARADTALASLRVYLRLSRELGLLAEGSYEHGARSLEEIGRLLGGWRKRQNST